MQNLEKILEEIDETIERYGTNPYIDVKVTDLCYGLNIAKEIIRKHMNDGKDINVPTDNNWSLMKESSDMVCNMTLLR